MEIVVNTLLRSQLEPRKIERIVWISPADDACFTVDITRNAYPTYKSISEITQGFQEETYIIEETDPYLRIFDEKSLSEAERIALERAWKVIQQIAKREYIPNIFIPSERVELIRKTSKEFNLSEAVISKYLKRYFNRGMTKSALLPDYFKCGGRGKFKGDSSSKKRGRPRKKTSIYNEMNIGEKDKKLFQLALNKYYYQKNRPTLRWTYEQMIRERYTTSHKIENGLEIPLIDDRTIPTFGQFRYWFEVWRDEKKEISSREGSKKYQQRYRPVLGTSKQEIMGPGSLYQIDATIADIYLVSCFDRNKIIGRPTIYLVCDTYSRLVIGLYIGLESASWSGAMMALQNAGESKLDYCLRYGIEINVEDWPSGLPIAILGDRGEIISNQALSMIENLHITVKNTSSWRPEQKSIVEKMFDLIQSRISPHLSGVIQSDFQERGGVDYRLKSNLTLDEYIKIVLKCVIFHNTEHHLSGYVRDPHQIADNVPPIPLRLWEFGMKHHMGQLRKVAPDVLRFNLMPRAEATITYKGIRLHGMYYSSERAINENWFVHARLKGTWKVDVSFDPRNVNLLYVRLNREEFDICYLLEAQSRYKDKSLDEVNFLHAEEKKDWANFEDDELSSRISLAAEIEFIVAEAKKKSRAKVSRQSNASRLRGIRGNREEEKQHNREQETFVLGQVEKKEEKGLELIEEEDSLEIDDIQFLIKKQRENFYEQ